MRKIWAILHLHVKGFFKSPGVLVLMFVMPVLFCFIFGGIAVNSENNKPIVNVVDNKDQVSSEVVKVLKMNDQFKWEKVSEQQAKKNVGEQKVVAAVVIPKNLQQRVVKKDPIFDIMVERKTEDYLALVPYLEGTAKLLTRAVQIRETQHLGGAFLTQFLSGIHSSKGVAVEQTIIQKDSSSNKSEITLMFVGFAIMFMMFGLSGAASTILDERKEGTWGRLIVSSVRRLQIISGYLLAYFLMGWIQLTVIITAMKFMYKTSWGNLIYFIPFASLVILCVVGFSLMIAGLVKTKQQAAAISAVLIVSTCMLGGVYWPIDIVPETMQKIALGVPQSWAMSGFKEIISGSLNLQTLLHDTMALIGFTIVFFYIGLKAMKFE